MAKPAYDVEALIASVKRRSSIPTSQLTFTDAEFTAIANDELQGEVVPLVMSTRGEYFVDHYDTASPASGIIPFPHGTVGCKVRSISYMQQTSPILLINLPQIDLDVVAGVGFTNYNTMTGFYIEGNNINLYPNTAVPANTNIRIYYYRRSLVLAAPNTYAKITSVNSGTNTIVVDHIPSGWSVGLNLNAVSGEAPFGITNDEMSIVGLSSPSIILTNVDGLAAGDYISEEGYSGVPQIPLEAHAYLAQLTAAKCCEGLGDLGGMKAALEKAKMMKDSLLVMISSRVDGSIKKIVNPNGGLRVNAGIGRWGRGNY